MALAILTMAALPLLRLGRLGLRRSEAGAEQLTRARTVGAVAAELAVGLRPAPVAGESTEANWDGRDCRINGLAPPGPGLRLVEVRCGPVRRLVLLPEAGGGL